MSYHTISHIAVSEVMLTWDFNGAMVIYSGGSLIRFFLFFSPNSNLLLLSSSQKLDNHKYR